MNNGIMNGDVPTWYELSFYQDLDPVIIFRVHQDWIQESKVEQKNPTVKHYKKECILKTFEGRLTHNFGFDNAMIYKGQRDCFIELHANIPPIEQYTQEPCGLCGGSGEWMFSGGVCFQCDGSGKEKEQDPQKARALCASIHVLLIFLYNARETKGVTKQLMEISTVCDYGYGSIVGEYSKELTQWLETCNRDRVAREIVKAMRHTWSHLHAGKKISYEHFACKIRESGWLSIDCPGDRAGIHPYGPVEPSRGYKFDCHNMDSMTQQFTILAALARLHDLARAAK